MKKYLLKLLLIIALLAISVQGVFAEGKNADVNVLLNTPITQAILEDLGQHGRVKDAFYEIDVVTMKIKLSEMDAILGLSFVDTVNEDAERKGSPVDTVFVDDFADGLSTWDLDAMNVTDFGFDNRQVPFDGNGVYVAVLDTGLVDSWRQYFPEERIAVEYGISFGGGGGEAGNVSSQPNKWEHDADSHGTHVTSSIIGYSLGGTPVNGVAPMAKIIPVKVLNNNGSGWSSVVAEGILYVANLKAGPLADYPVVINMSLGGSVLDAMEKAAIDYALDKGVIIVASAGNEGLAGMGYPGAYAPVISVASTGWVGEWLIGPWWNALDVNEPTNPAEFYISDFSSRALAGQDLDVAAPGSWVVGPYNLNNGHTSYYFLGGTSMASPHVAGVVALMAQKYPALGSAQAESILESSATYLAPGCNVVYGPSGVGETICWGADATGAGMVTADAALSATP